MTKTYRFIVSGSMVMDVTKAPNEKKAEERLSNWLDDNSPLRNWEIYTEGVAVEEKAQKPDVTVEHKESTI